MAEHCHSTLIGCQGLLLGLSLGLAEPDNQAKGQPGGGVLERPTIRGGKLPCESVWVRGAKAGGWRPIKKCQTVFNEVEDGKRILREIKLLTFMRHENLLIGDRFLVRGKPASGKKTPPSSTIPPRGGYSPCN